MNLSTCADAMRGLLDRNSFLRLLARFTTSDAYAVFVIEVDNMQYINAQRGASYSTELICRVAQRLNDTLPDNGLAALVRPNAVALLAFDEMLDEDAEALSARMHDRFRQAVDVGGTEIHVTISIGIAFTGRRIRPLEALQQAEAAVEHVKLNGGDATWISHALDFTLEMAV
ncbi:MAG TPA: diguanylate cyclase [Gemmatimonadaceae bacterium]